MVADHDTTSTDAATKKPCLPDRRSLDLIDGKSISCIARSPSFTDSHPSHTAIALLRSCERDVEDRIFA
jgi:hypothetical protein